MPSIRSRVATPACLLLSTAVVAASLVGLTPDSAAGQSEAADDSRRPVLPRPRPLTDPPLTAPTRAVPPRADLAGSDVRRITAPDEPYQVYVVVEDSYARCGPSGDDYRTDPLRHGQPLQVYVESGDGWLGVRPPAGSFCWVPASKIRIVADPDRRSASGRLGNVTEDRVVAWIGTHLGRARKYRWQVRLGEGEEVTVIGQNERVGPEGPQLWYRIAPPSGEFRWVHRDQVVESTEELIATIRRGDPNDLDLNAESGSRDSGAGYRAVRRTDSDRPSDPRDGASSRRRAVVRNTEGTSAPESQRVHGAEHGHGGALDGLGSRLRNAVASAKNGLNDLVNRSSDESGITGEFRTRPRFRDIDDARDAVLVASESAIGSGFERRDASAAGETFAAANGGGESGVGESGVGEATGSVVTAAAGVAKGGWAGNRAGRIEPSRVSVNQAAFNRPADGRTSSQAVSVGGEPTGPAPFNRALAALQSERSSRHPAADAASRAVTAVPEDKGVVATVDYQSLSGVPDLYNPQARLGTPSISVDRASGTALGSTPPSLQPTRWVSPQQIIAVENEVRGADAGALNLVLSRLMARQASEAEIDPVRVAATAMIATPGDSALARRIAERAAEYQTMAKNRDGQTVVRTGGGTIIPATRRAPSVPTADGDPQHGIDSQHSIDSQHGAATGITRGVVAGVVAHTAKSPLAVLATPLRPDASTGPVASSASASDGTGDFIVSGTLVQVYSARPNSPPYALTDDRGQTISYVTPAPGTSLHNHLNSEIHVAGASGFLEGMKTPHIVASRATRVR